MADDMPGAIGKERLFAKNLASLLVKCRLQTKFVVPCKQKRFFCALEMFGCWADGSRTNEICGLATNPPPTTRASKISSKHPTTENHKTASNHCVQY